MMGRYYCVPKREKEREDMKEKTDLSDMVECHYKGAITYIPSQLFISMSMR